MAIFQSPKNIFQRPKFPKFQALKLENLEPEKMQFHTPSHSIPPLDSLLNSVTIFGDAVAILGDAVTRNPLRNKYPVIWAIVATGASE